MSETRAYVLSTIFHTYFLTSCVVMFSVAAVLFVVTVPFDRNRRVLHRFTTWWGYHYIWLWPGCRATFEGVEHVVPGRTYVLVANHQSLFDILLLFGLFRDFKWVSKHEMFRVPFVGWNMALCDYVRLSRGDRKSTVAMMRRCGEFLGRGVSVMLFPEGTRSIDGEIQPFKSGAVALAIRAGVEVVPVVVDGTRDMLPKKGLLLRSTGRVNLNVKVLEPRAVDGPAGKASSEIRDEMIAELARMRVERSVAGMDSAVPSD